MGSETADHASCAQRGGPAQRSWGVQRDRAATRGRIVAVLGPDGAGKSTVIAGIRARLDRAGLGCAYYHWTIPWRPRAGGEVTVVTDPHGRPPKGLLASLAQLAWHLALAWPAWLRHVRPAVRRGEWVLLDRTWADLVCDPRRYRYGGPRWLLRPWLALLPRADVVLVLHAPADVILARKQEVERSELARQLVAYRLQAMRPRGRFIDASPPADTVVDSALDALGLEAA